MIEDIQNALHTLESLMLDKGVSGPVAKLHIGIESVSVVLWSSWGEKGLNGEDVKVIRGETLLDALEKAAEFVRSLPFPEEVVLKGYLKRIADAVDFATENSISSEFVDPLRKVTCAMTKNLLEKAGKDDA